MKEKNYKEQEQDKNRGKKKYRERLAQEREAEEEIKQYENCPDEGMGENLPPKFKEGFN